MTEPGVRIRPISDADRPMLSWLVAELWGSNVVAVHGSILRPAELPGFIAERSGRVTGLLTYQLIGDVLEIVTLNAIDRRAGIGTRLIDAAVTAARRYGCHQIRLTTTNDNVDALRFYQRRGFRLAELRSGAVDRSRQVKPGIPRTGEYGIPLHDEIDLTLQVLLAPHPAPPVPAPSRAAAARAGISSSARIRSRYAPLLTDWHGRCRVCDGDYLDVRMRTRSIIDNGHVPSERRRAGRINGPRDHDRFLTDSIDVCAVVIMGDALYKDIRLSSNRVRARRAALPGRAQEAGEGGSEGARQGLGARKRDAARG